MTNKTRIEMGALVLALVIFGMLTIITCAGVWNNCPEAWVKWCAGFLFAANAGVCVIFGRKISKDYERPEGNSNNY